MPWFDYSFQELCCFKLCLGFDTPIYILYLFVRVSEEVNQGSTIFIRFLSIIFIEHSYYIFFIGITGSVFNFGGWFIWIEMSREYAKTLTCKVILQCFLTWLVRLFVWWAYTCLHRIMLRATKFRKTRYNIPIWTYLVTLYVISLKLPMLIQVVCIDLFHEKGWPT